MTLLWLVLCSLRSFPLLSLAHPTAQADKQGFIQIYSDSDCTVQTGSPIPLLINVCRSTNESSSITAITLPSCADGGTPILSISDQERCGRPSIVEPSISTGSVGKCLFFATGSAIASTAFTCAGGSSNPITTTSHTDIKSLPTSTSKSATSTAVTQPTINHDNPQASGPGLSIANRIALGVGIGIGIPALLVAIVTLWTTWQAFLKKHQIRVQIVGRDDDLPPPYELHVR
jgi:hypothetical protein